MKIIKILISLLILFTGDILTKNIAINKLYDGGFYLFGILNLELYKNYGIAFGINIFKALIITLSSIIIITLLALVQKSIIRRKYLPTFFTGLIIIGAVSNLSDRIIHGYVIDFISIWIFPVFNLADLYITSGIIGIIFLYKKTPHKNAGSKN